MRLYIGSLHFKVTEARLQEVFEKLGFTVLSLKIMCSEDGYSRGFGFVNVPAEQGSYCIKRMDGGKIEGQKIKVREARGRA